MAEWHSKYRAKYELEKKVMEWKQDKKRILIVGTKDHTVMLSKYINDFMNLEIVGFVDFGKVDREGNGDVPYKNLSETAFDNEEYDIVLNSSFEFMYEISDMIKAKNIEKPVYEIYDLVSRSLLETVTHLPAFRTKSDY